MKSKIMKFFSDLGRSLMMPVAALAACGIILGITSALLKTQVQDAVPFLTASVPLFIITTLNKVSGIVFTLLPVLFAISIAFGLAKEDKGVAAFAGFIGYYTFLVASSCMISTGIMDFSAMKISNILGVDTVDMGALAGIMAGLVTAKLHNKYHKVQFPAAIAFYGGKRFVALVVLVSMTVIGLVMPLIWAPISVGIDGLGRIIRSSGAFGVFIFGTLERLLIPTGLHHVLNSLFRTTAIGGTYHGVEGCLNIFLQFLDQAPLSDMKPYTQFLGQGKMPYMLFGLPAAALAIYRTTPQDKKAKVKALMIAGVAACFVSGITEPLEFSFMFIAPALFVFHAIMGGISFMLMSLLVAFIVAALVRICVGSATVAMTMAAGIIAAMPGISELPPLYLACVVAAVAGGSTVCSHFNDSGFWLVRSLVGVDEKTNLKTWTIMETLVGFSGFVVAFIISLFV